jgi:hypothetical protein
VGGVNRSGMWVRDRSSPGWRFELPFDLDGDGDVYWDVAPDGSAISLDLGPAPARTGVLGLRVREYGDRPAPPQAQASRVVVTAHGRRARIAYTLTGAGRLVGSVWRGRHRVRTLATPAAGAGAHTWSLDLAPGRYRLDLAVCGAAGCDGVAITRSVLALGS